MACFVQHSPYFFCFLHKRINAVSIRSSSCLKKRLYSKPGSKFGMARENEIPQYRPVKFVPFNFLSSRTNRTIGLPLDSFGVIFPKH